MCDTIHSFKSSCLFLFVVVGCIKRSDLSTPYIFSAAKGESRN